MELRETAGSLLHLVAPLQTDLQMCEDIHLQQLDRLSPPFLRVCCGQVLLAAGAGGELLGTDCGLCPRQCVVSRDQEKGLKLLPALLGGPF